MKKINKKLIILIIFAIILFFLSGYYVYTTFNFKNKGLNLDKNELDITQDKPDETKVLNDITIDLVDYRVYKMDGLSFNFVIAKIRVKANDTTNINLSHFISDEGIKLNEVEEYVKKLEERSYFLGKQNVVFNLISSDKEYFANIFIPVINKSAGVLKLENDIDNKIFEFNLNSHIGDFKQLVYKADDVISDGKTYQMKVSSAFAITGEYMSETVSGQEYEYLLPSTVEVYAFNLEAVSLWKDKIVIESAIYETDSGDKFEALPANINSEKFINILGKEIIDKSEGSLFFVAYSPHENPVTYKGVLKLKVLGSDTWISVDVDLN